MTHLLTLVGFTIVGLAITALSLWRMRRIVRIASSDEGEPYVEYFGGGYRRTREDNPILFHLAVARSLAVWLLGLLLGFCLVVIPWAAGTQR